MKLGCSAEQIKRWAALPDTWLEHRLQWVLAPPGMFRVLWLRVPRRGAGVSPV